MQLSLRKTLRIMVLIAASGLAACGGGGSSSGGSSSGGTSQSNPITLMASDTVVNVQASQASTGASKLIQLWLENQKSSDEIHVGGTYSSKGIQTVEMNLVGATLDMSITFKDPPAMSPGTYTDTIIVHACREWPCVNDIAGSPKTLTINYTVTALPRFTLDTTSLSYEGLAFDSHYPPSQDVGVSFQGIDNPSTAVYVLVEKTTNGVVSSGFSWANGVKVQGPHVSVNLKPPSLLGPGTYTDSLTVRACFDTSCAREVPGSPATITVHYTVGDTVFGPAGYTAKLAANVVANGLAWDRARQVLYVSIAASSPANAGSIGVLDPLTGQFSTYAPVGNNPGDMEVSSDGQYLYVLMRGEGSILRLSLPNLAPDLTIPLGTRANGNPLVGQEMHVSPTDPHTIAIARDAQSGSGETELVVFDDAVMRPEIATPTSDTLTTFQWDNANRIFAANGYDTRRTAYRIGIDAGGAQVTASQQGVVQSGTRIMLVNGRILTNAGQEYDPLTFAQLGSLNVNPGLGIDIAADPVLGKAFVLTDGSIRAFDLSNMALRNSVDLPAGHVGRIYRWGTDGLALITDLYGPGILLLHGPFVAQ